MSRFDIEQKQKSRAVQWRGDNLQEVKDFVEANCRAYDIEHQQSGNRLLLHASFTLVVLETTDWFAPITPNGTYTRLTDIEYDNYYERGLSESIK